MYTFRRTQNIPATIDQVWEFISSPANLKNITPEYMGFDIVSENLPEKMYPGMMIAYKVSPLLGMKMNWVTEITHVKEPEYFVDEQRVGPYRIWHHQHHIQKIDEGTLMTDIVDYLPPFGFLGRMANTLVIEKQLANIFNFRTQKIVEVFGRFV
jgi:ligand-binding SRPBCC domain-containing protein